MRYEIKDKTIITDKKTREHLLAVIERFKQSRVLVVGDFMLDQYIWGDVSRISPEAPVPVVKVERESFMLGGALNVAHNIRSLGGEVMACGVIGRDFRGQMLAKTIRSKKVDCEGIIYDETRPTTMKTRVIARHQQVVRFDREDSRDISKTVLKKIAAYLKKRLPVSSAVIVEDYGKGVVTPALLKEVRRLARLNKKPVVVDPKERHFAYYQGVTAITPNLKEARGAIANPELAASLSLKQLGQALLKKMRTEVILITLGEDGMALFEKGGKMTHIPTLAREVFDVSGAGDTVIAVFSLALAAGSTMKEAAILSNLAAGIVVGKVGTATVSPQELKDSFRAGSLR
ncbi:MAG: D-glycero-beta-D-manno-heptose-7-phosphate kinase [Candidatus Omnitrophica bacterium]|nr:D-glycero-beta-D-manno-heptose-7-phosphate kinase [Candidatus Omnitrophota bacterium]